MRVVVQRVKYAKCIVSDKVTGQINEGLMLLIGFGKGDENAKLEKIPKMAKKIANLRIFEDEAHKMNKSIKDAGGAILAISQFTLYANPYEGNRPSFVDALEPNLACELYHYFMDYLRTTFAIKVEEGIFGADMALDICCDGPVTINLEY